MSIDWTRIYPTGEESKPNVKGLQYYHNVIDELLYYGIEPMVTICHFEMPLHLVNKYHSWLNKDMIGFYLKYCKTLFTEFKGKVKYWMTFNEINHTYRNDPMSSILSYMVCGLEHRELKKPEQDIATICYHMMLATAKAVRLGHKIDPNNKVGCVMAFMPKYAGTCRPEDALQNLHDYDMDLFMSDTLCNGVFPKYKLHEYKQKGIYLEITKQDELDFLNGTLDFYGLNYYSTGLSSVDGDGLKSAFFVDIKILI